MGAKRKTRQAENVTPAAPPRGVGDAFRDAVPDVLAAAACGLCWAAPTYFGGLDLIAYAAPLFLLQLPLSIIGLFGGVLRLEDKRMSRATKASFILLPLGALVFIATIVLGPAALWGLATLSATMVWRLVSGHVDRSATVPGAFINFTSGNDEGMIGAPSGDSVRIGRRGKVQQWRVPVGHQEIMAGLSLTLGMILLFLVPAVGPSPGGITEEVVKASRWSTLPINGMVPAHIAVASGVFLFIARILSQFTGLGAGQGDTAPAANVKDDPLLREIIAKVDATPSSAPKAPPTRKKKAKS